MAGPGLGGDLRQRDAFEPVGPVREQPLEDGDWAPEAFAVGAHAAWLWCANGIIDSRLSKAVGKLLAERAQQKGIKDVIFDRGSYIYHGRVKALADAAREAGLNF